MHFVISYHATANEIPGIHLFYLNLTKTPGAWELFCRFCLILLTSNMSKFQDDSLCLSVAAHCMPSGVKMFGWKTNTSVTNQSNPVAKEVSMAGAMSLAAVMMYFSVRTFLWTINREKTGERFRNKWYKIQIF